MPARAFIVHAHFYQPPREDPLTGVIPKEIGAAPFNNWNERIHAECYRPNAELRNFERISFNVGPTLFRWMEGYDRVTYERIIAQDQANVKRHGVGNAIAQGYNHTILPLASLRDKITQVAWGIADFKHRFGRSPQGMWLPETAVDSETLQVMADQGIEFTILAPWQAQGEVDVTEPYLVPLPDGRHMTVFFYQRDLSTRVSFDPEATINADNFARYLLLPYFQHEKEKSGEPQVITIASDGELYGHHQYLRDRFLARFVDGATSDLGIVPVYPALWLKNYPARRTVNIQENTSWSCHHGVSRWMGNCACTPGSGAWKAQMRYAMERLAGELDRIYLDTLRPYIDDPWELRNRYIEVILGQRTAGSLIQEMAGRALDSETTSRIHLLLEAQRERQRMFTSCGFYFEDFDRIEPRNNVAYAAQAVLYVQQATGISLKEQVSADLAAVVSERSGVRADEVFERHLERSEDHRGLIKNQAVPGESAGTA
ncbi:MAG: DUF3536 domain-containing protein [Chloroflexi bacterium]|nr:DUF3536 domain-containing protein [Chloroflexota bacterium]